MIISCTTVHEATISDYEEKRICIEYLRKKYDIGEHDYIDDDGFFISCYEISAGAHSYFEKTKGMKATAMQRHVYDIIMDLSNR